MNAVLYARVSTEKQADKELSIPAQLQAMRDYARQHGLAVVREFVEPGASAKTSARPQLQDLLAAVRKGEPRIEVVIVHKIDRLARNVYDHATIRAVLEQRGARLASVVENIDDTVSGQLVENIMASIAQFYSANLAEEVRKGMRQKVLNGGWPHLPPLGYVQVPSSSGRGSQVEPHPRLGPLVSRSFDLYATGAFSLRALADRMARDGLVSRRGMSLSQSRIGRLLSNPFYAGRIEWNGLKVPGRHKPLVTETVFQRVQDLVAARYRQARSTPTIGNFPLRVVAICGTCRGRMTAERHDKWSYYRCSRQTYKRALCSSRFCNTTRAHLDLERICAGLQITRETAKAVIAAANDIVAAEGATALDRQGASALRLQALMREEMKQTEDFTAGLVSSDQFHQGLATLRREQASLREALGQPIVSSSELMDRLEKFMSLATSVWDVYRELTDRKRAELLQIVFSTVVLGPEGIIGYSLTPAFRAIHGNVDPKEISTQLLRKLGAA